MFETIDSETVALPVAPVASDTQEELKQFAPLKREDYEGFKEDFLKWLLREGKSPSKGKGYAKDTVRQTHYRVDHAYRWKWEQEGQYSTEFTPGNADTLIKFLNHRTAKPESEAAKYQKSLKRLLKFFNETKQRDYDWDPDHLSDKSGDSMSHNYFKKHELGKLYNAATEISSFKSYHNKAMSAEERDRLKTHLAQRFEMQKQNVGPEDFDRANSWKLPSLIAVACDTGLRPVEVKRSNTGWLNLSDHQLTIPKDESSKGDSMWEPALSSRSVRALDHWLKERDSLEKYDGRDEIWLTKYGNPYESGSLNRILDKLLSESGIAPRNRDLTWYSIRRGVATVWANEEGIHNAKEQLRHKDIETTERYVHSGFDMRAEMADSKW